MEESKKEKILRKLRKLMNLKESAAQIGNEGEAYAAAAGIQRLLLEYNLTEDDIPEQEKIDNPIESQRMPYKAPINGRWYSSLIMVICEYNMCRSLIVQKCVNGRMKRDEFEIVGRKKNIEVVMYLTSFFSNKFIQIGKRNYPQYQFDCMRKYGMAPRRNAFRNSSDAIGRHVPGLA